MSKAGRGHRSSRSVGAQFTAWGTSRNAAANTTGEEAGEMGESNKVVGAIKRLCAKRVHNVRYYARLHTSGGSHNRVHWMNTVRVRKTDLASWYTRSPKIATVEKRCRRWFALGTSVGAMLRATRPRLTAPALLERMRQLALEYEFYFHSKSASQNISLMMARDAGYFPGGRSRGDRDDGGVADGSNKSVLYKRGGEAQFVALKTLSVPVDAHRVDYFAIVLSLCTVLRMFYERCAKVPAALATKELADLMLSVDGFISRRFIAVVSEDMQEIAVGLMREQQMAIMDLFDSEKLGATMFGSA